MPQSERGWRISRGRSSGVQVQASREAFQASGLPCRADSVREASLLARRPDRGQSPFLRKAVVQKKTGPLGPGFSFKDGNQVYSGPTPLPQRITDRAIIATSTTSPTASTELENRKPSSLGMFMKVGMPT